MPSPQPLSQRSRGFPHRERPQISHVVVGIGVSVLSFYLLALSFRPFLAETTAQLLSSGRIAVEKSLGFEPPSLVLRLMNGSDLNLALTWQRSGIFSLVIFWLLFVFLAFPLDGPLWLKIIWLEFGNIVGLAWSFTRFFTAALIAYHFGAGAFAIADFATSFLIDFLWVVPVWSLGLSAVISAKRNKIAQKR